MFLKFCRVKRNNCGRKGSYIQYDKKSPRHLNDPRSLIITRKLTVELEFIQIIVNRKYEVSKKVGVNVF